MKPSEQSIFKTFSYFNILNFPLTREELFRYLWLPPRMGFGEFVSVFNNLDSKKFQEKEGFYFFVGSKEIVEKRKQAAVVTEQKLIKARRAAKFIRSVPFLRAIFVCNSVGAGMAKEESDIDFFIVTEKNRIWIVRFFTNLILRLFGLRTYGSHQKDQVCLSFYVDSAHLNLSPWRVCEEDIHFAYWLHMMTPVYDPENYYKRFLQANGWVDKLLPNINYGITPTRSGATNIANSKIGVIWKKIWEAMWRGAYGNLIENEAKKFQMLKMSLALKEKVGKKDNGVVIADGIIKLHENDTRKAVREKWLEKINQTFVYAEKNN